LPAQGDEATTVALSLNDKVGVGAEAAKARPAALGLRKSWLAG